MADSRIQDLPAIDLLVDGDLFPVAREGDGYNARKVSAGQMTDFIEGVAQPYLTGAQEAATQAAMSAAAAALEVGKIGTAVEDAQAAQVAAETARDEAIAAGSGVDEKVARAETAAQNAANKAEQATTSEDNASLSAQSAETAKQAAEAAKLAAETAQVAAESASGTAALYASQSAQDAQKTAKDALDAQTAREGAEAAQDAIENLGVGATTLESGSPATVQKTVENGVVKLTFGLPSGDKGDKGDTGASMGSIERVSGTGAPGTSDTYNVVRDDGQVVGQFSVYNGADGMGAGDMLKSIYDTSGKNIDIFEYADNALNTAKSYADSVSEIAAGEALDSAKEYTDQKISEIPTPDVSAQISEHNASSSSHPDIRALIPTTAAQVNADPAGSADQALEASKQYTDTLVGDISATLDSINGEVI